MDFTVCEFCWQLLERDRSVPAREEQEEKKPQTTSKYAEDCLSFTDTHSFDQNTTCTPWLVPWIIQFPSAYRMHKIYV